jgi:dihydrofolate reductase
LKGRTNIVLSETLPRLEVVCNGDRIVGANHYAKAVQEAKKSPGSDEIFVIGGAQVYERALPTVDRLYITMVYGDHGCDVFFPNILDALADEEAWALVDEELVPDDHAFFVYQRFINGNS